MLAASTGMHEANAAPAKSPAAKTITKAKAQTRVRGTVPAGRAPIKSTRKRPLIARILAPSEGHLAGLHRRDELVDRGLRRALRGIDTVPNANLEPFQSTLLHRRQIG